ncbi:MAG: hypothetical protein WD063_11445 [Pirellulales bacterium]
MSTPAERGPARPYLEQPLPLLLIFGAFFGLTIPLTLAAGAHLGTALSTMESIALSTPAQVYVCCLGLTHFFLTLTIYFQWGNLRHFASSTKNRIIFFAVPIVIFAFFDLYFALGLNLRFVGFAVVLFAAIRFLDFLHFNRQNFGVHQLFKGKSGTLFPAWMRRAEQGYFMTLVVLIFLTFLAADHRVDPGNPAFLAALAIACGFFAAILYGYATAARKASRPAALVAPLGYLLLQSGAAGLAIYSTALYLFALAIHYVEYHVLMVPRCFKSKLDEDSRLDRWYARLRRHKLVFYAALLAISALYLWLGRSGATIQDSPVTYALVIHVFDGLFVFHYFMEAFIWKFGDPYFRKTLGPLYFPQPAPAQA